MQYHKYLILIIGVFINSFFTPSLKAQDVKTLKREMLDMVYVPQQDRFYAVNSVFDNPTKSLLYRINPYTAAIEDSVQVGYFIHKLDVTDDGRFLYIAERGSAVYRYDLSLKKVVLTIIITNSRLLSDSVRADGIKAVPQKPNSVVVVRTGYNGGYPTTVLLFEDNTLAATSENDTDFNTITFGKNPNILYVYDRQSTGEGMSILERQGTKWVVIKRYGNFVGTFSGDFKTDPDGYIYCNRSRFRLSIKNIFPEIDGYFKPYLEPDMSFDVPPHYQGDPVTNVIYALSREYSSPAGSQTYLSTISKSNYLVVKKTLLQNVPQFEYPSKFIHWGSGRLAAINRRQILFIRDCTPSVSTAPTIEQGVNVNVCQDSTVILSAAPGYAHYYWTSGDTGRVIKVNFAATLNNTISIAVAAATSQQGCLSPFSKAVNVKPSYKPQKPELITEDSKRSFAICQGDSVRAFAYAQNGLNFVWSDGSKNAQAAFKKSGIYTAKAISKEGCVSLSSDSISVTVRPELSPARPTVTVAGDTALCAGESVKLTAPFGFASYEWSNAATTASIMVNPIGRTLFGVKVTTSAGCKSGYSEFIYVKTNPTPAKPLVTANKNCFATNLIAEKYQWYWNGNIIQDATKQFYLAQQRGTYTVIALNGRCASDVSDGVNY